MCFNHSFVLLAKCLPARKFPSVKVVTVKNPIDYCLS